jgi:hypothetical protein
MSAVFDSFFATSDLARQALISEIVCESDHDTPIKWWGDEGIRLRAVKLLAAHRITLLDRLKDSSGGNASASAMTGVPTSISVSDSSQSVSVSAIATEDFAKYGDLSLTPWGLMLMDLIKRKRYRATGFVAAG